MVFITTGQRIATENFADGVIYKVTFVDTTISYMMCVGIGQDFVMLQGPNPSLFCLTMSSASRVSTIDIHDPTPPEPPTPIENALQYQTGEPPFTFTTTESSLFSWYIEGPCGVKTANLLNVAMSNVLFYSDYPSSVYNNFTIENNVITLTASKAAFFALPVEAEANQDYHINLMVSGTNANIRIRNYSDLPVNRLDNYISTTYSQQTSSLSLAFTTPENTKYILLEFYHDPSESQKSISDIIISKGSANIPYEPYGKYKISILSNDNAETIYLDEALAEGERLYSVNTDTVIATDIGENTLSVTPTPPEMQIVYGIYAEA